MCWLFVWFCVFFRSVSCLVFSHATKHRSCFGGRTATKVWNGCTPKVAHSYEHEPLPEHEPIAIMTTTHRFQASSSTFVIDNRLPSRGDNNNAAPRPRRSNDAKNRPRVRMCTYEESIFPPRPLGSLSQSLESSNLGDAKRSRQGNRWGGGRVALMERLQQTTAILDQSNNREVKIHFGHDAGKVLRRQWQSACNFVVVVPRYGCLAFLRW